MSNRVKGHIDHSSQSIFHHGLIKLIISTILQAEGKTWDFFLFWSGFQMKQEDQQIKKQEDKGKILVRKLKQKKKTEDKEEVKPKGDSEPVKTKTQMPSAGVKGKYSLFTEEEVQPLKHLIPAEVSNEVKAAVAEEVAVHEEELQTKQRSPINILSDDEGYLLE